MSGRLLPPFLSRRRAQRKGGSLSLEVFLPPAEARGRPSFRFDHIQQALESYFHCQNRSRFSLRTPFPETISLSVRSRGSSQMALRLHFFLLFLCPSDVRRILNLKKNAPASSFLISPPLVDLIAA